MDFKELAEVRPELNEIKREAQNWYGHPDRWHRYEKLKTRIKRLVGWRAEKGYPDFIYTREAYDIAHREILQ